MSKSSNSGVAVNSRLIRRPIQRWFPLFILPTFLCFIIGFIWPFLQGIYLSFCNFITPLDAAWVGLANYGKALRDPSFVHAFWNTAAFALVFTDRAAVQPPKAFQPAAQEGKEPRDELPH